VELLEFLYIQKMSYQDLSICASIGFLFFFSGEAGYGIEEIGTISGFNLISYQYVRQDKRFIF
jgi:hypothetical protein